MSIRTAAIATLLLSAACSTVSTAPDAGADVADARTDGERVPAALPSARPSMSAHAPVSAAGPVSAPAPDRRLGEVAARLAVADGQVLPSADTAPEPPAALLRAATRGRRLRGAAPRIVRSHDELDVWVVAGRGASHWTSHLHVAEPAPPGTRILPVYDLPYEDLGFALVDEAARTAVLLPYWPASTPFAIESVAATSTSDASALESSVELRWMKSCPRSRTECLLFGAPRAVAEAVDPLEPPGGWSIATTFHPIPAARALPTDADTIGEGVQIAVISEPAEYDKGRCGVWATIAAAPVEVLEIPCFDGQGFSGGIFASDELRIVWVWETESARVHIAQLDARTGAHRAPPRTAAADSYYEVDCGNVWSSTRPLPVLDHAHLGIAIAWGGGDALYFAEGATRGRLVRAELPADPFETDTGVSQLPPVLRAARCDGRRCVRPASP